MLLKKLILKAYKSHNNTQIDLHNLNVFIGANGAGKSNFICFFKLWKTAHHLSDGTLKFLCLATVLLQAQAPTSIILDEPELGLHPFAINILDGLIRSLSKSKQIILLTQSVSLLDQFQADDVIVTQRINEVS
ncbi:AAA family ATPase [Candidatus Marithrix sp. Canyon 246]|uniref:AAA family ATPase n=1 Tax=Candidatus Marithrix sp. Canyon 246 TaxID=1827136 RepID=UPI000849F0C2|nr:AAA family ATPase [Candidatus Marithrix sp. Canyon 246]